MPRFLTIIVILLIGYIVGAMYPGFYNQASSAVRGAAS